MIEAETLLRRTPRVVRALLEGIPERWIDADYGPDTFSPREVLGHLILGERTDWIPRARIILAFRESRPFDPFPHAGVDDMTHRSSIGELLDEFDRLRSENVEVLSAMNLNAADLERTGTHPDPAFGPVAMRDLLSAWVVHDHHHIAQMCKGLARQYRDAVGPWQAYLGILNR